MAHTDSEKRNASRLPWPFWAGIVFLLIIAIAWVFESPSREEAFGDTGKLWDLLKAPVGSWTPNYMLGHSLMTLQVAGWGVVF